jgi:hypothetical protein
MVWRKLKVSQSVRGRRRELLCTTYRAIGEGSAERGLQIGELALELGKLIGLADGEVESIDLLQLGGLVVREE